MPASIIMIRYYFFVTYCGHLSLVTVAMVFVTLTEVTLVGYVFRIGCR